MLLELYITIFVLAIISFVTAFFTKNVWVWAFTLILSGILIFASYDIVQNAVVVANQTQLAGVIHYDYTVQTSHTEDSTFSFLSIGLFLLSLLLFLNDLFQSFKEDKLGSRQ